MMKSETSTRIGIELILELLWGNDERRKRMASVTSEFDCYR